MSVRTVLLRLWNRDKAIMKRSSVSTLTSASIASLCPQPARFDRETTPTTGVVSSRSDVARCNGAHKVLLRLGKHERAWRKQYIHTIANELVSEAVKHDCEVIVFEDLSDIREQLPQAEWHHVWAFQRLFEYVEYKAPERVSPWNRLNRTTHPNAVLGRTVGSPTRVTTEENTSSARSGYELNADYNAATNIGVLYARKRTYRHRLRSSPKLGSGDAEVDVRVNGGTVNGESHQAIVGD
ncbi:MAG: transposase, IS605 OrfB family, central region [Haloquadratum walsbyi J07HQW1]|uniref:Transposase, IS605 OrfB family, central region n=1 Tax=Haloquadratum walsbyi J07HQW1 TaxID=1238424 RepID=U1P9G6_9EURY|nr:MAG: transposase, IS605 OrfB family, central region [Haloquadratum walsbyi J07HQW1]